MQRAVQKASCVFFLSVSAGIIPSTDLAVRWPIALPTLRPTYRIQGDAVVLNVRVRSAALTSLGAGRAVSYQSGQCQCAYCLQQHIHYSVQNTQRRGRKQQDANAVLEDCRLTSSPGQVPHHSCQSPGQAPKWHAALRRPSPVDTIPLFSAGLSQRRGRLGAAPPMRSTLHQKRC